ncbi:2-polyprenyl-6-methoxyphenol hydroxylase-like FAD-dependent oxidoreductase [Kitasatospora gansuensis]|uniref:2-polyprenyl-6-methoxyphenol hydroxylase-like FAD-dependent oxidoreductase n=1 Tax=Kitasatospora gansuensis TaxID=258050 RepID=A0A7W7WFV5_9ACTN|nr:flavin-dependent oxidoreductase [Kitasatospora gansuensis]MBB4944970.1 2-polyprenyl-6-methoxyphenol hydroxylase-like FAD-dependent oxidoreductase [Kitasatospora gansuensis]
MQITIAGAGIGGLATALSLHAAGFEDVVVHEAAPEIRPLGVGINLLPHAVRELTELGLAEKLAAIAVPTAELAYFNRHGQAVWAEPRGLAAGYRWPQYSVHRGRLQLLLLDAVRERLGTHAVRTASRITSLRHDSDLLVGADGIHSAVRSALFPDEGAPPWNGLVLWRGTSYGTPFLTGRSMIMAGDGTQKFVAYPIGDGRLVNWIAEQPLDGEPPERGNWNRPADPAAVARQFADWTFDWLDVPGLIAAAEAAYEYPMVDRDPLPSWSRDDVVLLGDAAHAMYPVGSNGASQAIIDARVLAHSLATTGGTAAYEELRRPATTALQLANRQQGPEVVMRLAHERAPDGFDDIEQVVPLAERTEIAAAYKRTAGFDPVLLNSRPSWSVR